MSFYDQQHDRDRRLGAGLRALPVPEHAPGFWDDLEAQLEELGARPRVALGGDPAEEPHVLATPAEVRTSAAATRRAARRRRRTRKLPSAPRPRRTRRGGNLRRPARAVPRLGPPRRRRGRRVALVLGGGVLVALLVLGVAWLIAPDDGVEGIDAGGAPATSVAAPTTTTPPPLVGPTAAWSGEAVVADTSTRGKVTTAHYAVAAQQDRATRLTTTEGTNPRDVGDDPSVGVRVEVTRTGPVRSTGLPPGGLDDAGTDAVLHRRYGDVVAAMAAAGDPAVTSATVDGRAVWQLTSPLVGGPPAGTGPDQVELVVDQVLGLPLHVIERWAGTVRHEMTLTIAPEPPATPPGLPTVDPDDDLTITPGPWRPATAAEARLVATTPPVGFMAVAAAVADQAPGGGPGGTNPTTRASQVVYRQGWQQVVVTVWATGADPALWADPLGVEGVPTTAVATPLIGGALAGVVAQVVVQPDAEPHLWAVDGDHVVLITGPLPGAALTAVANSLAAPG